MALINRISRLFRADMHAVLDRIEEPDILLKQAVREMEEDIASDEKRVKLLQHDQGQLTARQGDIEQSLCQFEGELDICFASAKEDLARELVKRKLEGQRYLKLLKRRMETNTGTLAQLQQRLAENHKRLLSMKQKLELLTSDEVRGSAEDRWLMPDISVSDADVEVALLREKQGRSTS